MIPVAGGKEVDKRPTPVPGSWAEAAERVLEGGARRVLIATAGFGDGHNRAAEALEQLLCAVKPQLETLRVDVLSSPGGGAGGEPVRQRERYYAALRTCPRLYHVVYQVFARLPGVLSALAEPYVSPLKQATGRFCPDVVAVTHVFCARAAEKLRRSARTPRLVGVPTDWVDDAYWNQTRLDEYLVATDVLRDKFVRSGIQADRVHVTGLPVTREFWGTTTKSEARAALGLAADRYTVLVLGGGLGLGALHEATRVLVRYPLPTQVVVVAGRNEDLRSRLEILKLTAEVPLMVVGYTERMHDYMSAADLVVTKPGGMTVAECLARGLPMALLGRPLPGPETLNEAYLLKRELAVRVSSEVGLLEWVKRQALGGACEA